MAKLSRSKNVDQLQLLLEGRALNDDGAARQANAASSVAIAALEIAG